jgi:hypothetical protein
VHRILSLVGVLVIAGAASSAVALGSYNGSDLTAAKKSTEQFRSPKRAVAAGYAELRDAKHIACISMPGMGAMGIHYVNGKLVKDGVVDPRKPEAVVYEPDRDGHTRHLVALEYIVFKKAWKHSAPPRLFGRSFDLTPAGNRFGLPAFYSLHAWLFKHNPAGKLTPWNPRVSCP